MPVTEEEKDAFREAGKVNTWGIIYSKYRNNSPAKCKLKKQFPSIIACIDKIKKYGKENFVCKKGKESFFPNLITSIESYVFIDVLYPAILKAGYPVITKHDSQIFYKNDQHNIDFINDEELNKINYKCKFKLKESSTTSACLYVATMFE